jgi:hypothetical protein
LVETLFYDEDFYWKDMRFVGGKDGALLLRDDESESTSSASVLKPYVIKYISPDQYIDFFNHILDSLQIPRHESFSIACADRVNLLTS